MNTAFDALAIIVIGLVFLNVLGLVLLVAIRGVRRRRTERAFAADTVPDSWVRTARRQIASR